MQCVGNVDTADVRAFLEGARRRPGRARPVRRARRGYGRSALPRVRPALAHLGLHAWKGHEMTAAEYRRAHGLARSRGRSSQRGGAQTRFVTSSTRETIAENARRSLPAKSPFVAARIGGRTSGAAEQRDRHVSRRYGEPSATRSGTSRHRLGVRTVRRRILPFLQCAEEAVLFHVLRESSDSGARPVNGRIIGGLGEHPRARR